MRAKVLNATVGDHPQGNVIDTNEHDFTVKQLQNLASIGAVKVLEQPTEDEVDAADADASSEVEDLAQELDAEHIVQGNATSVDESGEQAPALTEINGIGPSTAEALREMGFADAEALANIEDPATIEDYSPPNANARTLVQRAEDLIAEE
jgi:predicted flap endonuclease-1-like 5' DNA nuclease